MTYSPSRAFVGYNILLLAVGSVVLLTLVSAAYLYSDRSQGHASEALRASRIDRLALEVVTDLVDAETAQRGFIITNTESYLAPYETALVEFARDAEELRMRAAEIGEGRVISAEAVADLLDVGARKLALVKQNLAEFRAGHLDEMRLAISSDRGKTLMDDVRTKAAAWR